MPPDDHSDGGRDRHVRDVTAADFHNHSSTVFVKFPTTVAPITPSSSPDGVNCHPLTTKNMFHSTPTTKICTEDMRAHLVYPSRPRISPLLTPCSSSDSLSLSSTQSIRHDTPAVLQTIFPNGILDVEVVHDISAQLPHGLKGVIVDRQSGIRSVYILGLGSVTVDQPIRDIVIRVLDLADEEVEADQVIFALEKQHDRLRELLQGLLYVGGVVVKNDHHEAVNNGLVLVGIEV